MSRGDTAGRGPRASRRAPSRSGRTSKPLPKKLSPRVEDGPSAKPRTTLTSRAAILAIAVAAVVVAAASPLQVWLGQRHSIGSLQSQISAEQAKVAQLQAQHDRWSNPSYVKKQAERRLHYVVPGKKSYVVLGKTTHKKAAATTHAATVTETGPWYSRLWQSMQVAGGDAVSSQ